MMPIPRGPIDSQNISYYNIMFPNIVQIELNEGLVVSTPLKNMKKSVGITPQSSSLGEFSLINHPFFGRYPSDYGNPHQAIYKPDINHQKGPIFW